LQTFKKTGTFLDLRIYIDIKNLISSEEHIIKGCKRYDMVAQKALYERHNAQLRGLVRRYVDDADDAKDVLQEAFLLIFNNIVKFKGEGSLEGWMKRIVVNTALQFIKKQKRNGTKVRFDDMDDVLGGGDNGPDEQDTSSIFELALQAEMSEEDLLEIIGTLDVDFRQVFNLYVVDQYSHAEIASLLGIDIVTSRTRLARAKKKVQAQLHKRCAEKISAIKLG
jgi:RNA polymerase sigma-70 factor (ECF subfamily)